MQFFLDKFLKIIGLLSVLSSNCFAGHTTTYPFCDPTLQHQTNQTLHGIYISDGQPIPISLNQRIQYFSQLLLDKPYTLTALGEGRRGKFDQAPLYRLDAFDCQTYVETVLALALSDSTKHFTQCLQNIRYAHGEIDYLQRHHFTSPDWNSANQQLGLLKDITETLIDANQKPSARYAQAEIDQANWYQHFDLSKIRICYAAPSAVQHRLKQLQTLGKYLPKKNSRIAYIPIQALISKDEKSRYLLGQIPNGAIIEIIRPNWNLTQAIGTHLNVSHLGFVIREQGVLFFYQASSLQKKVTKLPLVDYLISMRSQPTVQGINVQVVLPTAVCVKEKD